MSLTTDMRFLFKWQTLNSKWIYSLYLMYRSTSSSIERMPSRIGSYQFCICNSLNELSIFCRNTLDRGERASGRALFFIVITLTFCLILFCNSMNYVSNNVWLLFGVLKLSRRCCCFFDYFFLFFFFKLSFVV